MPSPADALDLLLRVDSEPWGWDAPALPVLAARLGGAPPVPVPEGWLLGRPDGSALVALGDRDGVCDRLACEIPATSFAALCATVGHRLGPYVTARRCDRVTRWWTLPTGRHLEATGSGAGVALDLVRQGVEPPPWVPPAVLCDAAADVGARIADAGYVPVEDESLPDMAAALGGRLSWPDPAGTVRPDPAGTHRHILLPQAPFQLELIAPVIEADALTWYAEVRVELFGSGDVPGSSRRAGFDLLTASLVRRWGAPTIPGPEARFWERDNGWTVAVDRSDGLVRLRLRPPRRAPVRPPE